MVKYLKSGKSIAEKENEDQKTKEIVENVLKQIENGGDKAVRMLSEKFDDYSPTSFKLSDEQMLTIDDPKYMGINTFTMGPADIKGGLLGMYINVYSRKSKI